MNMGEPLKAARAEEIIAAWDKAETAQILTALAAVDAQDLDYLQSCLNDSGMGQFWKAVIADLRPVFTTTSSLSAVGAAPP